MMDAREQVVRGGTRHAVARVSAPCRAHGRRSDPKRLAARVRVHHRILERLLREEWDEHCEEDVVAVALAATVGGVPSAHPQRLVAHTRELHATHLEARLVLDLGWLGHVWMVPEPTRACAADRHRAHVLLRRRRTAHDHEPRRVLDDERDHHELARRQLRQ